ncbi:MAG: C40 family peptidase [Desulfovibrio sp.]
MFFRRAHARSKGPRGKALLRLCLFGLAALTLAACSVLDMGKARIPPGASHGTAGRSAAPGGYSGGGYNGAGYSVADTARSAIGRPYRWGGDSPGEGFDCSGLVYWAFARHGVRVPRPSWEQIHAGVPVGRGAPLVPGDLLFFKTVRGSSFHVGIYAGGGVFVHSPKSGQRVRESSLAEEYWRSHYVGARRISAPLRANL